MKNIHLLPIDKPSRIRLGNNGNFVIANFEQSSIRSKNDSYTNQHIYITSDEEIKLGDWYFNNTGSAIEKLNNRLPSGGYFCKKIILTTDQDLIKDGVQAIDDEFLEWFVKNPSCEKVEVKKGFEDGTAWGYNFLDYKIIIPKEELKQEYQSECICENSCRGFVNVKCKQLKKQETLEEAAKKRYIEGVYVINGIDICDVSRECFIASANFQAERMYSEQEVLQLLLRLKQTESYDNLYEWFEQFKKK